MADLTSSVGEGGQNRKHDVALVEAILRVVKDAKGQPYFPGNYSGTYSPQTAKSLQQFQNDNGLVPKAAKAIEKAASDAEKSVKVVEKAVKVVEKAGFVGPGSATMKALESKLPVTHKPLEIIPDTVTVYLAGNEQAAKDAGSSINADAQLDPTFRAKCQQLVQQVYATHKIVLWAGPSGRYRSFQQQANLPAATTKAGPGESNHNFGRATDMVFKDLGWLAGDGQIVHDDPWLQKLSKVSAAKADAFWDARDVHVYQLGLFTLKAGWDRPHVQSFDQSQASMGRSLAALLSAVGKTRWSNAHGAYKSDLGLSGTQTEVGTAKNIWKGESTVSKLGIAQTVNSAKVTLEYARSLWAGKVTLKKAPTAPAGAKDVTAADIAVIQRLVKGDFVLAEQNYLKWKPVP